MRKPQLVVIGNGMAGVKTLEELLKLAPDTYDITVFGSEPHPNYNRVLLSPVLAGEQTLDDIVLNDWSWYREHGITLHAGWTVTRVDRRSRTVHAMNALGRTKSVRYDRLLLATGSTPFILPLPGKQLPGVMAYRDMADTQAMIDAAAQHRHAVVIGGGVLGLEAANGLMKRGMAVTVVHVGDWLMERQLDARAGQLLQRTLEAGGMRFALSAQTTELVPSTDPRKVGRVGAVRLADGRTLPADLVVMAVGIRPNVTLAESMHLQVNRGIVVTDTLQTVTDARIYAVGECVAHRGVTYGLVAPLYEQAKVAASHLAEVGIGRYLGSVLSTKLKVTGIDLFSAGDYMGGDGTETIELTDMQGGVYKKLVMRHNQLVGACLYGDTADSNWYLRLLREGRDTTPVRDRLAFGEAALTDTEREALAAPLTPAPELAHA